MLMKLTPVINFINVLHEGFLHEIFEPKITKLKCLLCNFLAPKYRQKTRS